MHQTNERLFLLGEGRGGRGIRVGDEFGGRVVDHAIIDAHVSGVVHGGGCVDRREQVEGWHLELRHVAGGRGRAGKGRTVEEGAVAWGGALWTETTTTTTSKQRSKH